jgi:fructoselysine transporter
MQTSILGVIPWQEVEHTKAVVSLFVERVYGGGWADLATALILITAFGSVFSAMLGYSRVPYAAARDGNFFAIFGRIHEKGRFPYVSLLALGAVAIVFSLSLSLRDAIRSILAMRCIIQFVGQAAGLILLRRRWPLGRFPFQMVLYPLPVVIGIVGWTAIFFSTGLKPMIAATAAACVGILVYLVRAKWLRQWPFQEVA